MIKKQRKVFISIKGNKLSSFEFIYSQSREKFSKRKISIDRKRIVKGRRVRRSQKCKFVKYAQGRVLSRTSYSDPLPTVL